MQIQKLRISFIWHQSLMEESALARPLAIDRSAYDAIFAASGNRHGGNLTPPWPPYEQQGFWEWYLGKRDALLSVDELDARKRLVPLRTESPLDFTAADPGVRISTDGFLHGWGASFVLTLALAGPWPDYAAAVDKVLELRSERCFELGSAPGKALRLDDLGHLGLEALRGTVEHAADGTRSSSFSVASLIAADGEDNAFDPASEGSGVLGFLHALTSFSTTWSKDRPHSLEEAKVGGLATGPASHLIYGSTRGRMIWGPEHFQTRTARRPDRVLPCHHRNLVLASMQTEALGRYASETARRLNANLELSGEHNTEAELLCEQLKAMYDGAESTYKSGSVKAQISHWLPEIDTVCAYRGLPALTPAAPPAPPQPSP